MESETGNVYDIKRGFIYPLMNYGTVEKSVEAEKCEIYWLFVVSARINK